jgi:hypothetical protein
LGVCGILGVKPIHTQVPCEPPILEISRNAFNLIEICYFPSHNSCDNKETCKFPCCNEETTMNFGFLQIEILSHHLKFSGETRRVLV